VSTRAGRIALAIVPVTFIGYFFVYPVARILMMSIGEGFGDVLTSATTRSVVWFTLWQAAVSTLLTFVVAMPLTAVLSHFTFPGRSLVRALVTVPFVLPTVVVGSAFVALGMSNSIWGILAAHVFFNVAVVVRTVGGVWSRLDRGVVEAARSLGASPFTAFRRTTLPILGPSIAAALSIVFLFTFTSFGVVLILGGLRYRTIEVQIYREATTFLDLGAAGALAILQLVGVVAILWAYGRYQRTRSVGLELAAEDRVLRAPRSASERAILWSVVGGTLGLLAAPLVVLVARSLRGGLAGWEFLIDPGRLAITPGEAITNSLLFAVVGAVIATVVGLIAASLISRGSTVMASTFDTVLMLPLGTSAVTIGFGFLVALDEPIDLRGTTLLVPLAHALVAVPFVVRSTLPTLRAIRSDLREAAAVLGASPRQVFRHVDLAIVSRAAMVGAGFAAAVSLGEFGATSFIVRPNSVTIPTLIFRLLGRPGAVTFTAAMALSVVLMLLTTALILSIDRLRAGELGEF
jgi:thiamine transport system permease protein